ncbi:MAG: peptidase M50 [Euryarchaeota archaeon]|nr:peptidase M50 [Euryarchaeota archaeon]
MARMDSTLHTIGTPPPKRKVSIRTSSTELQHLFIAWIAIAFAFAYVIRLHGSTLQERFIISLFTVGVGFLLHELAHKVVAQRYNLWAEFRMSSTMLMLAVGLAYLWGVLLAAPGAVYISGSYITGEQNGRIAAAGPITNVFLATIFLLISTQSTLLNGFGEYGWYVIFLGVQINLWLATFNMLPLSVLDGRKVFAWSKPAFAGVFLLIILMWIGAGAVL